MKIVINTTYGGFGLSDQAIYRYAELKGIVLYKENFQGIYSNFYRIPVNEYYDFKDEVNTHPSDEGYVKLKSLEFSYNDIPRNDSDLVRVVEELGDAANFAHSKLKIVEIPSGVDWMIDGFDGIEWVSEKHRSWK